MTKDRPQAVKFAGNVLRIDCGDRECEVLVASVFGEMRTSEPATLASHYRLGRDTDGLLTLHRAGELLIRGEAGPVLQMLTSHCLEQFAAEYRDGLMFHAAAVASAGQAMLLPAQSGTGKTILTAWLCDRGFAFLSDEAVFVPRSSDQVEPFRRFLDVKASGRHALGSFIDLDGDSRILRTTDGFLIPPALMPCAEPVGSARVSAIVFSRYQEGSPLEFEPISAARAGMLLMSCLVNARNLPNHGFDEVTRLARISPAYSLRYGGFEQIGGRFDRLLGEGT